LTSSVIHNGRERGGCEAGAIIQNLCYGVKEKKPIDTIFPNCQG